VEMKLSRKINCFLGKNGSGKTNLLDAIYYLSLCKSYFNPIDGQNILHGQSLMGINGLFEKEGNEDKVHCGIKKGQKKIFKKNNKEYERFADHIGLYPVVMISPYDTDLINEGSEVRRKFIDGIISQFDKKYLDTLIDYNKALSQRNALLKSFFKNRNFSQDSLDVWNMQLENLGMIIFDKRKAFLSEYVPIFQKYFEKLTLTKEKGEVEHKSGLYEMDYQTGFDQSIERDKRLQYTNFGVHKDDLTFQIDGFPIKKYGSQGQQKSFLIALKLAQFELMKKIKGYSPILLLDDIFDKLDSERVGSLMEVISEAGMGQVFITDTDEKRLPEILEGLKSEFYIFKVDKGEIYEETGVE